MIGIAALVQFIILLIVLGLVFYLLRYLIGVVPMEPPYRRVAEIVVVVVGVLVLIGLLLNLAGYPIIHW